MKICDAMPMQLSPEFGIQSWKRPKRDIASLEANAESGKLVPMSVKVGEKAWLTKFTYPSPLWSVVFNTFRPDPPCCSSFVPENAARFCTASLGPRNDRTGHPG